MSFAEVFHVRPWEMGLLTVRQFLGMREVIDGRVKRARKRAGG